MTFFNDTKITYADKSDKDLIRAYLLFRIISSPIITKILTTLLRIANNLHLPIKNIIKTTIAKKILW